jgi:hypothetical protein
MAWIVTIDGQRSTVNRKTSVRGRRDRYVQFSVAFDRSYRILNAKTMKDITHKFDIEIQRD